MSARTTPKTAMSLVLRLATFRAVSWTEVSASPLLTLLLWSIAAAAALILAAMPVFGLYSLFSSLLATTLVPLLIGLCASAASRVGRDAFRVANAVFVPFLLGAVVYFAIVVLAPDFAASALLPVMLWMWFVVAVFLRRGRALPWQRKLPLVVATMAIALAASLLAETDMKVSEFRYGPETDDLAEADPGIDSETFWMSQHRLLAEVAAQLTAGESTGPRTYIVTLAPDGSQALFAREATMAGAALTRHFGGARGPLMLSNNDASVGKRPAAIGSNLHALAKALSGAGKREGDLIVVYLTAHGAREAYATTVVPEFSQVEPVSAQMLREVLDESGIARRVVIVSACYSGSWIAPLKTPDTIVLTASAADRTSFGCSNERTYTLFGEALHASSMGKGASLSDAFAHMKAYIARAEAREEIKASQPQAFVGANMRDLWSSQPSGD